MPRIKRPVVTIPVREKDGVPQAIMVDGQKIPKTRLATIDIAPREATATIELAPSASSLRALRDYLSILLEFIPPDREFIALKRNAPPLPELFGLRTIHELRLSLKPDSVVSMSLVIPVDAEVTTGDPFDGREAADDEDDEG